jgi:hypothetical protein
MAQSRRAVLKWAVGGLTTAAGLTAARPLRADHIDGLPHGTVLYAATLAFPLGETFVSGEPFEFTAGAIDVVIQRLFPVPPPIVPPNPTVPPNPIHYLIRTSLEGVSATHSSGAIYQAEGAQNLLFPVEADGLYEFLGLYQMIPQPPPIHPGGQPIPPPIHPAGAPIPPPIRLALEYAVPISEDVVGTIAVSVFTEGGDHET